MNDPIQTAIRPAVISDGDSLFELAKSFATSFAVEASAFHGSLPRLLEDSSACLLVAEIDGKVVGYILGFAHLAFFANGAVAWVEEIAVAEALRQRGIGRHLMDAFDGWASARQCRLVALATRRAAPFYLALGYEESASYFRKLLPTSSSSPLKSGDSNFTIHGLDHVQLAMPAGQEETARAFYAGTLGLREIPKPANLAKRGGVWFEGGVLRLHLGVEADFRPAKKAHPALLVRNLNVLVNYLQKAGVTVVTDEPLEGYDRIYVSDPFGNRLELLEPA